MKEQLDGKLVEILTSIQGAVGKASDFAMAELPDIAQSYVAYGRVSLTAAVVVGLLLWAAVPWLLHKTIKNATAATKASYSADGPYIIAAFIHGAAGAIATLVGSIFVLENASRALLVWFAPKVWLLKEIAGMLK